MEFAKIVLSYILGYVRITVEGYYIERFINICINSKILIWNIKREKGGVKIFLNVGLHDFKKLIQISKKTKCKIKINRKRGIPFILNKYRKRKIFALFLGLVAIAIMISSNYIWNIEIKIEENQEMQGISGNAEEGLLANTEEDVGLVKEIEKDIAEAGLTVGKLKTKVDTSDIIRQIRLKRDDISWIGIELKGTNAIVKIVKAEEAPKIIDENDYTNIVADKSGVITKIIAQNGTAKVKVGDTVEKGTVLIEGTMQGKYTSLRYVHSIGEIEAKVWYTKTKRIYFKKTEKEYTNNVETKYKIKINKFEINLYKTLSNFEIYDTIEEEKKIKIFSDFYLPITLTKITNKEQKNIGKEYSLEEAKNQGIQQIKEQLENEIGQKGNKVGEVINTNETEEYIDVTVTYEVLEKIGTEEKIQF